MSVPASHYIFPVTCNEDGDDRFNIGDVIMVFEYGDFDLAGLLDSEGVHLTSDHIRSYTHQLLEGVHYMHNQNILHRDLKSANILITRDNVLKIADWGLARQYRSELKNLTPEVVTLWYRAPEVCYRTRDYGPGVDMWAVGCIFAEFFNKAPIMRGKTEEQQLDFIYTLVGQPTGSTRELFSKYPDWGKYAVEEAGKSGSKLAAKFNGKMDGKEILLLEKMLQLNPTERISAKMALNDNYFYKPHKVCDPCMLPKFNLENGHEYERQEYKNNLAANAEKKEKEKAEERQRRQLEQKNRLDRKGADGLRKSSKFKLKPPSSKSDGVKRDIRGMVRPSQSSDDIAQKAKSSLPSTATVDGKSNSTATVDGKEVSISTDASKGGKQKDEDVSTDEGSSSKKIKVGENETGVTKEERI